MARRKTCRSDRAVRVSFEISRLSERIMIDVYEQVLPIWGSKPKTAKFLKAFRFKGLRYPAWSFLPVSRPRSR